MSLCSQELNYDLHCHSTASDGELSPSDLVNYAAARGVGVLALTDHDDTSGLNEAAAAAKAAEITLISGVEISVTWNKRLVHIVGLGFNPDDAPLQRGLADLRTRRDARAEEMAARLAKKGVVDALEGARRYSNGRILSRTHFARYMVEAGYVKDLQAAFSRYIGDGKYAYVATEWATLEEAVGWIRSAGGMAVIAHPARYKLTATKLRALIEDFKACGGVGIEVVSGSQGPNETRNMAGYAERYGLYASRGSDYHGPSQPWLGMGHLQALPSRCNPIWSLWQEEGGDRPYQWSSAQ